MQRENSASATFLPVLTLSVPVVLGIVVGCLQILNHPVGLAALPPPTRALLYTGLAGAAGALLGFVLATLAILLALPDREITRKLRKYKGWRSLEFTLLATGFDLFVTLVLSLVGLGWNTVAGGIVVFVAGLGSGCGLLVSGALFTLVLANFEKGVGAV